MKKVRADVDNLLMILKENREKHSKALEEITQNYREKVIIQLERSLRLAKEGGKIITCLDLEKPLNMTKSYDRAIGMLEMSVDKVVEITQEEYSNFVLDRWHWSSSVSSSSSSYNTSSTSSSTSNYLAGLSDYLYD